MARRARVVIPGLPHHVLQRAAAGRLLFTADRDYRLYLRLLRDCSARYGLRVWAYCLMPDHVHFICVPRVADSLARVFNTVHMKYALRLLRDDGRLSPFSRSRFRSCVLDDASLFEEVRFVESNPVRKGLVERPWEYTWSSAVSRVFGTSDPLLSRRFPLIHAVADWRAYLLGDNLEERLARGRSNLRTGRPCGDSEFVSELECLTQRRLAPGRPGRPRGRRDTPSPPVPSTSASGQGADLAPQAAAIRSAAKSAGQSASRTATKAAYAVPHAVHQAVQHAAVHAVHTAQVAPSAAYSSRSPKAGSAHLASNAATSVPHAGQAAPSAVQQCVQRSASSSASVPVPNAESRPALNNANSTGQGAVPKAANTAQNPGHLASDADRWSVRSSAAHSATHSARTAPNSAVRPRRSPKAEPALLVSAPASPAVPHAASTPASPRVSPSVSNEVSTPALLPALRPALPPSRGSIRKPAPKPASSTPPLPARGLKG